MIRRLMRGRLMWSVVGAALGTYVIRALSGRRNNGRLGAMLPTGMVGDLIHGAGRAGRRVFEIVRRPLR